MSQSVPFTPHQRELWLAGKTSRTDFTETAIRVDFPVVGAIAPERLRRAILMATADAPLLTAAIREEKGQPVFLPNEGNGGDVDFRWLDLRGDAEPDRAALRFLDSFYEEEIDSRTIRYAYAATGTETGLLAIKCSHLAVDGVGVFLLVARIAEIYSALTRNAEPAPAADVSVHSALREELAYGQSERARKDDEFWDKELARLPEQRVFRPLPGRPDTLERTRFKKFPLSKDFTAAADAFLNRRRIAPNLFFTALHALVVGFMTGEREFSVATPVSFGDRKNLARRAGMQVSIAPIYVNLDLAPTLDALLNALKQQTSAIFRHVRTPFQHAMRRLAGKDFSHVGDTALNYLPGVPEGNAEFRITACNQRHSDREPALLSVLVMREPGTDGYSLTVRNSRNHLTERDVKRYAERMELVGRQLIAGSEPAQVDFLLDEEKRELAAWERGPTRPYRLRPLGELWDEAAARFAERPAVRDDSGTTLTYREVRENSLRAAARLAERGVARGDIVAIEAARTANLPEVILGIWRLGALYLPLDPEAPAERRAFILEDAGARLTFRLDDLSYRRSSFKPTLPPLAPNDGAYLIYTSGSTGTPKGVLAPHGGFANMIQGQIELLGITADDRVLQFAPPAFDASLSEMFMALLSGACLYPVGEDLRSDPWSLKKYLADNGITVATLPPSYLNLFNREPFAGLRVLLTAGEAPVADDAFAYAKTLTYFNAYGPTETCVCAAMKRVRPGDSPPIAIGGPIPNVTLSVRDRFGRRLPAGMAGELWIGGASVALGYHNRPDLTAERFRPPSEGDERAYATGDVAVWSDAGEIVLLGRSDDQVKIRGNRVELGEVAALLERCPEVAQATALAVRDAAGNMSLAAFVVPRAGADTAAIAAWGREHLPRYMLPSSWCVLDAMPMGSTGKIDKKALTKFHEKKDKGKAAASGVDPRLVAMCERVLGRACDPAAGFFEQGGDSLTAMALLREIRNGFGVDIAFRDFAGCPTIADLQNLLGETGSGPSRKRVATAPLSEGQFQIWAYQRANEGTSDYNMPLLLELRGERAGEFVDCLAKAINDQELFSCRIAGDIDKPRFVLESGAVHVRREAFSSVAQAAEFFDAEIHRPFDLRNESPVRLFAVTLPDCLRVLVLAHHIAADGETFDIVLANARRHFLGEAAEPAGLSTQAEFCRREEEYLRSPERRTDEAWRRKILTPAPLRATGRPTREGAMASAALSPEAARALEALAGQTGATALSCFLALAAQYLCRRYGREETVIGVPAGLRETRDEFAAAGFFVHVLPLRLVRDEDERAAARTAAAELCEAVKHSRYGGGAEMPEFIVTQMEEAGFTAPGLEATRLDVLLRAAKFPGSFTLVSGSRPRIVLEYDTGAIPDGPALVEELARAIEHAGKSAPERSPRRLLADAWRSVLPNDGGDAPNDADDFFRDGGDSIKAIQMTGQLRRRGVTALSAADFLRTPRFGDLAARLDEDKPRPIASFPAIAPGTRVPLLPFQSHFIATHPNHWREFFFALPLPLPPGLATETVENWLRQLPAGHEAFRLAFFPDHAEMLASPQEIPLFHQPAGEFPLPVAAAREAVRTVTAHLDPATGKTLGAYLTDSELLLIGHHLVLDAASIGILQREFADFCRTGRFSGEEFGVAAKATEVENLVQNGVFPNERQRNNWRSVLASPTAPLAAARKNAPEPVRHRIGKEASLAGLRPEYSRSIQADLLSALAKALYRLGQRDAIFLTLESHGRDDLPPGFDAGRSVGWFTAVCPMPLKPVSSCAEAERAIRLWLGENFTPEDCNAFGYLRRDNPDAFRYDAPFSVNYLGRLTGAGNCAGDEFTAALATPGAVPELLHPDFIPENPLDATVWFDAAGALRLGVFFCPRTFSETWVDSLLREWTDALKSLPLYLPDETLAAVQAAAACAAGEVEKIVPPEISREPMLYQSLTRDKFAYTQQIAFSLKGPIDEFALARAWPDIVNRHESLRSLFPMPHEGEFYRLVLREARTSAACHNLSALPAAMAEAEAKRILETARATEFDLQKGPLLRAHVIRLKDDEVTLAWTFHHLLMDGWCIGILLRELFTPAVAALPKPFDPETYAVWRRDLDDDAAREYWATLLNGFDHRTGVADAEASAGDGDPETETLVLTPELTEGLRAIAVAAGVSLSVLTQALWAQVLSSENGFRRDVAYGVVTSGRPADLDGIERAVGLFLQTVPLRVRWSGDARFADTLVDVKKQGLEQMRYGYLPLAEMGRDLVDHLFVFENYPVDTVFAEGKVRLREVRGFEKIPYPLGISALPGEALTFRFLYDPVRLPRERVAVLMEKLHIAARLAVEKGGDPSCREIESALASTTADDFSAPFAAPSESSAKRCGAVPVDDVEKAVLEIYESVLGNPVPSLDADFFHLGGHSLLAMRVLARVRKSFVVAIGIDDIMANPSVRALASRIRAETPDWRPLSPAQRRIWFLERIRNNDGAYVIPFAARLPDEIDAAAFQNALKLLERRHDALRLRVAADEPVQMPAPVGSLRLEIFDEPFTERAYRKIRPELGRDKPLVRVALYRGEDSGPTLLLCFHHIIFDGWSAEIFVRELNEAYAASIAGVTPSWRPLELDYLGFVEREAERETPAVEAVRKMLTPPPEPLPLPLDFPRPAQRSDSGRVHAFDFGRERSLALKRYAADAGVTTFTVISALVKAFLYRHTGRSDLTIGCPAANREFAETENMLGLFVNTLALRTRLDAESPFEELVKAEDKVFKTALAAQSYPFDSLVDDLGVERNAAGNPLFDVFVALEDASWSVFDREPLRMRPLELPHEISKFDVSFYFRERRDAGFDVHIEYCADLFAEETVRAMADRFLLLTDSAVRRDGAALASLDIVPEAELALLDKFNATDEALDGDCDIDTKFVRQLRMTPDAAAVIEASGAAHSYVAFDERVAALAAFLRERGIGAGKTVGVCFERSLDLLVSIFAVIRVGGAYVPLSANLPDARLSAVMEDLGDCTVLCPEAFAERFKQVGAKTLSPDIRALPAGAVRSPQAAAPDSVAYVIFTSGSTGRPKGVQIEHRSVCNRLLWMQSRFPIGPGDVILQKTTVLFDVSVWELFWWSWCGAALALLEEDAEKDPAKIVEAIRDRKVTVMHFVPSMLRVFLEYLAANPGEAEKLATLRYVFASGEALSRELVERFNALLGGQAGAELHNLYGPTEATVDVSWQPCLAAAPHSVPIGRPVANTRLHILDERGRRTPIGVAGEIHISGVQVARGYVNRPELTAERFVPDPFNPPGRMYRTGDVGRWRWDGTVEYLGRNDDQVKIRGFRIELGEVEAALERCSGVAQAVVRVCRVGGYDALEAFLLPRRNATLSFETICRELAAQVPGYMIPALFHTVEHMPLGSTGKADRKNLRGVRLLPRTDAAPEEEDAIVAGIREMWREVLPESGDVDLDTGFFEAGGNSLLLVRLHGLLDARWPGVFTLAGLFSESGIRAQARLAGQTADERMRQTVPSTPDAPVAVIGMAVRFADYDDTERFWEDLAKGADKTIPMPEKRRRETRRILEATGLEFDEERLIRASYLSDVSSFDYRRLGFSPGDATLLDPKQRLFFETALRALDDAGYGGRALENADVGVFVGASPFRMFQDAITRAFPERAEQIYLLNVPSNVAARISFLKNWRGPAAVVDTACSSVLTALHEAIGNIRKGECRVAVVGGVHTIDFPLRGDGVFTIESASGQTRTFDAQADGVGAGEGAAVFILKPLEQALRDNDSVRAVILGSAVNQDGKSSGMAAPNPDAQADVIAAAARNAGVSLADMDFFEAHGTATALGDPVEIDGLRRAYARENVQPLHKALIASVKGNLGHLDAAAGAAGLAKAILCLENGAVPPQPYFERPNPRIDFDTAPVTVAGQYAALPEDGRPWRCGVSSFGLSGVNAHAILSSHDARSLPGDDGSWLLVPFSAPDEASLDKYLREVGEAVRRRPHLPLHAVAGTLATGRDTLGARAAAVARTPEEFLEKLSKGVPRTLDQKPTGGRTPCAGFSSRDEAEQAAKDFLEGAVPAWPDRRPLHRIHLPPTPFKSTTLWPKFTDKFLSEPIQTPTGAAYSLSIERPDFWPVAEHKLQGAPTLVGMGLVDLMTRFSDETPVGIEKLRWRQPITHTEGARATLVVRMEDDARSVILYHNAGNGWTVAAEATTRQEPERRTSLDVEALRKSMTPFEPRGDDSSVAVGERWRCRESAWKNDGGDRLLAFLSLPEQFRDDLATFRWHPAMLDVAASLALHGARDFVPAMCERISLQRPLPPRAYSFVTVVERRNDRIVADCVVMDEAGGVVLEMSGLTFLALRRERAAAKRSEPRLYALDWKPADLPPAESIAENDTLLLCRPDAPGIDAAAGVGRPLPATPEERTALAREIIRDSVSNIVYLPDTEDDAWAFPHLLREVCRNGLRRRLRVTVVGDALSGRHPENALGLGPVLCLGWEEPLVSCTYIEADSGNFKLTEYLGRVDGPCQIAENGDVLLPRLRELAPPDRTVITDAGCVVITGGLGGMGLTLAEQIRSRTGARVVLLHRGPAKPDIPFDMIRCDVADARQVEESLSKIRREIGKVQGVIHAAGIAGDGFLATRTREEYEAVLEPKVTGTINMHNATLGDDLAFFVLASSRTSLVGAPGQSDYVAANAFLNAFAKYRRNIGLPALSLCWNTWADIGMAARRRHMGRTERQSALAPEQAFEVLEAALAAGDDLVVVAMADEDIRSFPLASPVGKPAEPTEPAVPVPAKSDSLEAAILEIFRDCLGYDNALGRDDDFFDLGGDSLAGARVVGRLDKEFGVKLGVFDLLEAGSLGEFIDAALAELDRTSDAKQEMKRAPKRDKYPVGREQRAILYADLASGGGLGFNLPSFLALPDDVDETRLEAALAALVGRHEALRTSFLDFETEHPNMTIRPAGEFRLEKVRISDLSKKEELITPFDVRKDALFRAKIVETNAGERFLFLDVHHSLADGRSVSLFNVELFRLYHDPSGRSLEAVGAQQKDIAWHQFTHPDVAASEYWRDLYADELPKLDLPSAQPRPKVHSGRGGMHEFSLASELVAGVKALARREGATNYQVVLAAWSVLIGKYADSDDFVIAVMVDNRAGRHNNTVGMLASLLPLRFGKVRNLPLADLLRETRRISNDAIRHRAYILNDLLADLRPPANPGRAPLSEVILSYMNFEFVADAYGMFETLRFDKNASKNDLSIFITDTGGDISFAIEYYADLFSGDDIARLSGDFVRILELMVAGAPDEPVRFERKSADIAFTHSAGVPEGDAENSADTTPVEESFLRAVRTDPDRTALSGGGTALTFAELEALSERIARFILEREYGTEPVVGVLCERGALYLAAAFGAMRAGAAYLPVERELPLSRREYMLRPAKLIIADAACIREAEYLFHKNPGTGHILCIDSADYDDAVEKGGALGRTAYWEEVVREGSDLGWRNDFDLTPLPRERLEAMAGNIVNLAGLPQRAGGGSVLDVGSGSGVVAQTLAGGAKRYSAVELARNELDRVGRFMTDAVMKTHRMEAIDIEFLGDSRFDAVVLNGVAENFPGYNYLRRTLSRAVGLLAEGGTIVVGAVRDLERKDDLREALLEYAADSGEHGGLLRFEASEELFVPKSVFSDWANESPVPVEVSFSPTPGFSGFRYDVVVTKGGGRRGDGRTRTRFGAGDLPVRTDEELPIVPADRAAYIVYTSGSTGQPKGVVEEQRHLAHIIRALDGFSDGCDRVALVAPLSFDASIQQIAVSLFQGKPLHILSDAERKQPAEFIAAVGKHRLDLSDMTPAFFNVLVEHLHERQSPFPMKRLLIAGEVLRPDVVRKFYGIAGNEDVVIFNIYGPTECTVDTASFRIDHGNHRTYSSYPIGRPLPGCRIEIRDDKGRPLPDSATGELWISGDGVSRGYLNGENAGAFVGVDGRRHYLTGDQGFIRDGLVFYRGRRDQQVKIRGNRVEVGEVEEAIAAFPGIGEVAVVADVFRSGEEKSLAAYVVGAVDTGELRRYLERRLPSHCVPEYFVPMHELPFSVNRKVDKKALPSPLGRMAATAAGRKPEGALEEKLAEIWKRLLGVEVTDADAGFFTLGGHSIMAIRLIAMLEKELGANVSVRELFDNPSIALLAKTISGGAESREGPVINLHRREGGKSIFFFHPVGGSVFCYSDLAGHLSGRFSVYAVEAAGFRGEQNDLNTELHTVESLADYYLGEILKTNAEGIIFGGWSFGGLLAYEAACRYRALGYPAEPVLVLDSVADNSRARKIAAQDDVELLKTLLHGSLDFDEALLRSLPREEQLSHLVACGERSGLLPAGFSSLQMDNLLQTYRGNAVAAARYGRPTPSDAKILFIRAVDFSDNPQIVHDDIYQGWSRFLKEENITLEWTEGTHETILSPGLAENVARLILEYLDNSSITPSAAATPR